MTLGGIGILASLGEFTAGRTTIGSNFRLYVSGWGGSGSVSTIGLGRTLGGVGIFAFYAEATAGGIGLYNYYRYSPSHPNALGPKEFAVNMTISGLATFGGRALGVLGIYYYVGGALPGGWPATLERNDRITRRTQEILDDPSWNLYGRGMEL